MPETTAIPADTHVYICVMCIAGIRCGSGRRVILMPSAARRHHRRVKTKAYGLPYTRTHTHTHIRDVCTTIHFIFPLPPCAVAPRPAYRIIVLDK